MVVIFTTFSAKMWVYLKWAKKSDTMDDKKGPTKMKVRNMMKMGVVAGVCAVAMTAGVLSVGGMAQNAFASEDATLNATTENALSSQDATLNATTETALASEDASLNATAVTKCSAMHRLYNKYTGEHFYTASGDEKNNLVSKGWNYEGIGFVRERDG